MKKKIVILQNSFWGKDTKTSGGETRFVEIFKRIQGSFNGTIITCGDGQNLDKKNKIKFKYIISPKSFDKFGIIISYIFRTIYAVFKLPKNVNIIYSNSDFFPDVIPAYILKIINPKVKWVQCVFHVYVNWDKRPGNKITNYLVQISQQFSFLMIRKSDTIININNITRESLILNGINPEKIYINPVGINYHLIINTPKKEDQSWDAIYLGRINPSKGIFDLPNIWKLVINQLPKAKLVIAGGGDKKHVDKLLKMIRENKLEKNITLSGYLSDEEIYSTIKSAKIFVFPSHEEGFGITIAEAMACGLPVVTWNLPIYSEVFNKINIGVKEGNYEKFSEKIIMLLTSYAKLKKYVKLGKKFIKKYGWSSISQKELLIINHNTVR